MRAIELLQVATFFALASAAIIRTEVPIPPCDQFLLKDDQLYSPKDLLANSLSYNVLDLINGNPPGPFFNLVTGPNCYWIPNSEFRCNVEFFYDPERTWRIGSGRIYSPSLQLNQDTFHTAGGYLYLDTTMTLEPWYLPSNPRNFLTQHAVELYFEKRIIMNSDGTAYSNRVQVQVVGSPPRNNTYLSLWGSNGWDANAQRYLSGEYRGTAMDLRIRLECPPENTCVGGNCTSVIINAYDLSPTEIVRSSQDTNCIVVHFNNQVPL
jgi:hypothetical protein